jgi:hypothetical protein
MQPALFMATASSPTTESTSQALLDAFVQRLQARDNPPPPSNDAASVQQRLAAALRPLLPGLLERRIERAARVCYAFYEQPVWTSAALSEAVGGHRGSAVRALAALQAAGLTRRISRGMASRYELTRDGEALLLSVIGPGPDAA